jgi:hypothetical protein
MFVQSHLLKLNQVLYVSYLFVFYLALYFNGCFFYCNGCLFVLFPFTLDLFGVRESSQRRKLSSNITKASVIIFLSY